jgi:ribose transport system substrate-binding protein
MESDDKAAAAGGKTTHVLLGVIVVVLVLAAIAVAWSSGAFRAKPHVAIVTSTEDAYWDRVILGAERAAKHFDVKLTVVRSKADDNAQSQIVRDLIAQGIDGIAVSPVNAQTQTTLLTDVSNKIPLVTFDSDCPTSNRKVFIGTDNYVAGRQCGETVREALPDGGEIIICVGSVEKENGRNRRQGLIDNLMDRPLEPNRVPDPVDHPIKGDKYTVVTTLIDNVDTAKATALAVEAINKHPNLKCLVGLFGYSTPALLDALKQTNKLGQIKVIGFDEAEPTLAGIEAGQVYGTLVQDQYNMGYDTVRFLHETLRGVPSPELGAQIEPLHCRPITSSEEVSIIRFEKQRESGAPATQPSQANAG